MLLFLSLAFAHKPSFGEDFSSPEQAFLVDDPNISIVIYQEITCELSQLWLELEAEEDMELYVQGGVPVIDRLEEYRPTLAVLAPGLPDVEDIPFELPPNLGALILEPEETSSPFYEPFTQTESWIWVEETIILPEAGTAYIVGWNEEAWTGKMWIATGTVEDFSDASVSDFIEWGEKVNNFHETGKYEIPYADDEISCATEEPVEGEENKSSGCQHTPTSPRFLMLMLPLLLLRRRTL